jgi:hypothetical protein
LVAGNDLAARAAKRQPQGQDDGWATYLRGFEQHSTRILVRLPKLRHRFHETGFYVTPWAPLLPADVAGSVCAQVALMTLLFLAKAHRGLMNQDLAI